MKRIIPVIVSLLLSSGVLVAAEKANHVAQVGQVSLGFTFNPASMGSQLSVQPKAGEYIYSTLQNTATHRQMFMLSQDPIAALRLKYRALEYLNFRMSVGFSGSHINYSEYVRDDLAYLINPFSEAKVSDIIMCDMNSTNIAMGVEYTMGKGNLRFVAGANILYALGGSKIACAYGNELTALNQAPSTMGLLGTAGKDLNEWKTTQGITYARPVERKNEGFNHGVGFQVDMGVEYYFMEHLSLGATVTFTPIMAVFQPQTYAVYEGYSSLSSQVETYNAIYSQGSWMLLYGTQNLGVQLSLNYYF